MDVVAYVMHVRCNELIQICDPIYLQQKFIFVNDACAFVTIFVMSLWMMCVHYSDAAGTVIECDGEQ